ncbi:MAG: hypothetical protein GEU71_15460 [Actinobacteria bacterium]|nr:hypothetical protein [Actinomycetota bacterium]
MWRYPIGYHRSQGGAPLGVARRSEVFNTEMFRQQSQDRQRVQVRAPAPGDDQRPYVLFVCVEGAGRSRMAEAFFNKMSHSHRALAAGTKPAAHPLPTVVSAMREIGLAIVDRPALTLSEELSNEAELVIGMGCDVAAACPALSTPLEDWELEDPKGKSADDVAMIRDLIELRVRNLIGKLGRDA